VPQTGRYKVYGTWNSGSSRASNAKYTINAGPTQQTSIQNQRLNGGQWNLLGEYSFDIANNQNGQNNVSLSSEANGYLIADAIKLELIEENHPAPSGLFFIHNDHLGTPKRLTDTQGQLVWSLQTTPFGEVHEEIANGITLLNGFPGQYRDSETGLSYNYYRDYDPSIGRYIESDPIGLKGGLNTYTYVQNMPMNWIDPIGLEAFYCQRPLGDYSGENGAGPLLLNHQFICVTDANGMTICDSQNNPDDDNNTVALPSPGVPSLPERDNMENSSCNQISDDKDQCFEQCVMEQWEKPRPNYTIGPLGTDCQEYSSKISFKCSFLCSVKQGVWE
jgi:RHS repeat-associated protein